MQGFDSYDIFTEIIIGRILHALMWQKSHVFSKCKTQKPHFEKIIWEHKKFLMFLTSCSILI